ncbi:hypothetical protein DSO57_1009218 [Entomophthora muscae]|uniref:Uncharacterized protein n=1 Tax=Entomophthora muscae TaxID=34485 RepID=A0ACC2THH9_9FUNG|nr:hypothetical protein DSO57_1009218 [Entomophthora muscae]
MKDIPTAPPLPDAPPIQDFSKLGFLYITVLGLDNQVMPHTESWRPLATALNYLVCIAPIVYMDFQAWPASPVGVQPESGIGCDRYIEGLRLSRSGRILSSPFTNLYLILYPKSVCMTRAWQGSNFWGLRK